MKKKIQKPFDAEAAKRGATIETKSGDPVRILCYDRVGGQYPIIALTKHDGVESCVAYTFEGKLLGDEFNNNDSKDDLIIVEEVEEPEFNVGDWVFATKYGKHPWLITARNFDYYEVQDTQGNKTEMYQTIVDTYFRLWTLKDAKPGDVLIDVFDNPFIFKGIFYDSGPTAYCGIDTTDSVYISDDSSIWTDEPVRPATYKERQQFFDRLEKEGYKWDADSLTLSKIQKRWRDNEKADINGYYIDGDSSIILAHSGYNSSLNHNVFVAVKQAKSALAMARISQIMANDERFGGVVTDEEWGSTTPYFVIAKARNMLVTTVGHRYEYLGFHTMEQAKLFLEENEDLVKAYYMLG